MTIYEILICILIKVLELKFLTEFKFLHFLTQYLMKIDLQTARVLICKERSSKINRVWKRNEFRKFEQNSQKFATSIAS